MNNTAIISIPGGGLEQLYLASFIWDKSEFNFYHANWNIFRYNLRSQKSYDKNLLASYADCLGLLIPKGVKLNMQRKHLKRLNYPETGLLVRALIFWTVFKYCVSVLCIMEPKWEISAIAVVLCAYEIALAYLNSARSAANS